MDFAQTNFSNTQRHVPFRHFYLNTCVFADTYFNGEYVVSYDHDS